MEARFAAAFLIGLRGRMHCVGMCGPLIALAAMALRPLPSICAGRARTQASKSPEGRMH
ncbi:MAG: sulfite exporter TauE/SafE family protein [Pseudomonadota bacterium]